MEKYLVLLMVVLGTSSCRTNETSSEPNYFYSEPHRLQYHFSPDSMWMNDPNGMVYFEGEYHLFYQYYPDDIVWGPMHWGHAISEDLIHWEHMPIAIYPDSLGWIFSGSAVADLDNTSGFGTKNNPPLVAIYTYHNSEGQKAGKDDYQTQGIAYSVDKGRTWTKYDGNPVLGNPGIRDYRDPKVIWHHETNQWVMVLAVKDRVHLYSSTDLKSWNKESEFGEDKGAHGGVWECPDLIQMDADGRTKWVMLLSINPGGPNGGSATQYFVGDFNGKSFTVDHDDIRWLDWGPDNYAGVTWANVPDRHVFIGWMSNWAYGQKVPTERWRSSMTIPRTLALKEMNGEHYVVSQPVEEFEKLVEDTRSLNSITINGTYHLSKELSFASSTFTLGFEIDPVDFSIILSNYQNEQVSIGFEMQQNRFFIDRRNSGKVDFSEDFPMRSTADRISSGNAIVMKILVDVGSVEVFADEGMVTMTSLFFPNKNFTEIDIITSERRDIRNIRFGQVKGVWGNGS